MSRPLKKYSWTRDQLQQLLDAQRPSTPQRLAAARCAKLYRAEIAEIPAAGEIPPCSECSDAAIYYCACNLAGFPARDRDEDISKKVRAISRGCREFRRYINQRPPRPGKGKDNIDHG